ncbi:alpha-glucan family phosphorylase [bacterium]|nr:MAG: alpha-glucan family phosphorylase [bacterium]
MYRDADPRDLPVEPVNDRNGQWLKVAVPIANHEVQARVWRAQVGRVTVYLLDTNCPDNSADDRDITFRLYGGDERVRIRQEMVLGIGGARALKALGISPAVWHMNEGHAAFLVLERLRDQLARGLSFDAGLEAVAAQSVFTTHTPVAAGHDAFPDGLFLEHFVGLARSMGLAAEQLLPLGRAPHEPGRFNMTRLALNGARRMNGVSRIHGAVSSQLCAEHWREIPPEENPMGYVTNGIHVPTFISPVWSRFFDEHMPEWRDRLSDDGYWQSIDQVRDEAFWAVAQDAKSRMISEARL